MARAIELARLGWGRVAPNPMVGAVLLKDGSVVGEGVHREFGGPHAEVQALTACPDPEGGTCVVNLEPCNHLGKTAPCVDALVSAKVKRVVAAIRDPNPQAGGGVERLREAGVEVHIGMLAEDAAALNAPFLWATRRPGRPFVALKLAMSLDGFIADASGNSQWVSGPEARAYAHALRAGYDAIGVGRRTAELDDPELTARGDIEPRVAPRRIVFTETGRLRQDLKLVVTAREIPTLLVVTGAGSRVPTDELELEGVDVLRARSFTEALADLRESGITTLLIEGGGNLAGSMLGADVVDRVYLIQAPMWLGSGTPAFSGLPALPLSDVRNWTVTERKSLGRDNLIVLDRELCLVG